MSNLSTHSSSSKNSKEDIRAPSLAEGVKSEQKQQETSFDPEKQNHPSNNVEEEQWIHGLKLWIIILGITLVIFLMLLDISIVSTATPKITSDFHSLENVGWYGAAYQLTSAVFQPLTGKIFSNFDTKWTFFAFFLIFELGSLLCGVAVSSNMLIVSRAVAGIGSSGLTNGALTIIAGCVPMYKRPMLIGIVLGVGQLGLVGGPLIGGLFTQFVSWRWCFYINLPIGGFVAALLVFTRIPEQIVKPSPRSFLRQLHLKLDLIGFVIFAPGIIMLLLAVQWGGNQYPWNSGTVIGLICGAVAIIAIWSVWNYYKKESALLPFTMLRKRYVWTSFLTSAFLSSAMFCTSYYLPIYFQGVRGKSPAIAGVYLLPSILSQLVGGLIVGKAIGKFGYYLPWSVASGALTAVGYGLLSTLAPHASTGKWVGYQILFGFGRGFGLQVPIVAVQNTLAPKDIPTAMGLVMFGQTFGGALFLSFADTIFTNSLRSLVKEDAPGANVDAVVNAGAYGFRKVVPVGALNNVLKAYARSVDNVFYMCVALAVGCFVLSWGMGWVDIRQKKTKTENKSDAE